jgi:hypothetical protein
MRAGIQEVERVLVDYAKYQESLNEIMSRLSQIQITESQVLEMAKTLTRPKSAERDDGFEDEEKEAKNSQAVNQILTLVESGMGTEIPGVRGTAYGFLNAVSEYVDHYRKVRAGERDVREAKFESLMLGGGAKIKQEAFNLCYKLAA